MLKNYFLCKNKKSESQISATRYGVSQNIEFYDILSNLCIFKDWKKWQYFY